MAAVRALATLVLWLAMLAPWQSLVIWIEAGRKAAAMKGTMIEPDFGFLISLPFWLLILACYLAAHIVRRLERLWERGGW